MPRKSKGITVLEKLIDAETVSLRVIESQIETLVARKQATVAMITGYISAVEALKAPAAEVKD